MTPVVRSASDAPAAPEGLESPACGLGTPKLGTAPLMTLATLVLDLDARAPSKARGLLAEVLADQAESEPFARARLALSEIVSNAVRHGGAGSLTLSISRTDDAVIVSVTQPGPVPPPPHVIEMPGPWSTSGYGLGIIDGTTDRWGVRSDPPAVWFELRL